MKQCTVCSAQWPDNMGFCGNCGGALVSADETALYDDKTVAVSGNDVSAFDNEVFCDEQRASSVDNPCVTDGYVNPDCDTQHTELSKPKKKKAKKLLIIAIVAVALIIAVIVTGFCTNWFGLCSPLNDLLEAFNNTAHAENLTFKITLKEEDRTQVSEGEIEINAEDEKLTYFFESDTAKVCSFDNYLYKSSYGYGSESKMNYDVYFEDYNKFIAVIDGEEEVDWEEFVEVNHLEDHMNADEIEPFLQELYKECFSNKKWLEEYMGFEKDGDNYIFDPDLKKLFEELKDICNNSDAFTKDGKEEITDDFDRAIDNITDDESVKITITVESGYIKVVKLDVQNENADAALTVELSDINETEITDKELNKIKDEVVELIEDNTCDVCGMVFYNDVDKKFHGDCEDCNEHVECLYELDNAYYCYDCYEANKQQCEFCGDHGRDVQRHGGLYMCKECYDYYLG